MDAYLSLRNLMSTLRTHELPRSRAAALQRQRRQYTTKRLREGRQLEDDVERNIYGRWLAYLYLVGENIEEERLRKGCARLLVIEPNHTHTPCSTTSSTPGPRASACGVRAINVLRTDRTPTYHCDTHRQLAQHPSGICSGALSGGLTASWGRPRRVG